MRPTEDPRGPSPSKEAPPPVAVRLPPPVRPEIPREPRSLLLWSGAVFLLGSLIGVGILWSLSPTDPLPARTPSSKAVPDQETAGKGAGPVPLQVFEPKVRIQREPSLFVSGKTAPGATVSVNEVPAAVDPEGRFGVLVPLVPGSNRLVAVARTPSGSKTIRELPAVVLDPGTSPELLRILRRQADPPP